MIKRQYLSICESLLEEALENPGVDTLVAGELLRRGVQMLCPDVAEEVTRAKQIEELLARYEESLMILCSARWRPADLREDLKSALSRFRKYGATPWWKRDLQDGEDAIQGLDEVISVAVALTRAKMMTPDTLQEFGDAAYEQVKALVGGCPELCQLAEDYRLAFPHAFGEEMPYRFLEVLAEIAPSRYALRSVVRECSPVDTG